MENIKTLKVLTVLVVLLSGFAAIVGIFSGGTKEYSDIVSAFGETIQLYNKGLYARDSVSVATQAIAQDVITLVVGIPFVLTSLYLIKKRSTVGLFLLTGTIAYFLYTYTSYAFIAMYNPLYLVYVFIMSFSFYGFILCMKIILQSGICNMLSGQFPVNSLSKFLWITGLIIGLMWLGRIVPTIANHTAPFGLEHYSTLGIQTLDLGFIVPACFVTGHLLRKRNQWGYLLSVVLVSKAVTMTAAVSTMAIMMKIHGVEISAIEMIVFPVLLVICSYFMVKIFKHMKGSKF